MIRLKTSYAVEKKKKNFPDQPQPCNQPHCFPLIVLCSVVLREEVSETTTLPLSCCLEEVDTGAGWVASGGLGGVSGAASSKAASSGAYYS